MLGVYYWKTSKLNWEEDSDGAGCYKILWVSLQDEGVSGGQQERGDCSQDPPRQRLQSLQQVI